MRLMVALPPAFFRLMPRGDPARHGTKRFARPTFLAPPPTLMIKLLPKVKSTQEHFK